MGQTYTRQSSFADGDTITAALFNNEYNQLVNAFSYSATNAATTGHRHDGSAGEGGNIPQIGDLDFLNKIVVDSTNNRWGFYVQVSTNTVEQIRLQDGALLPVTDSDVDLGTSSLYFKDAYIDSITTTGNVAVGGNLTVTGTTTFNGGTITMGDAATDNVVFGADVDSNIIPDDDDSYDLGSSSQEWRNLYIDGTANIDSLVADTADINGGTIDGAVIGGSSAAAITGTTITGTAITGTSFVIGSADISEAELEILDGATVTTDELNILDGVTSTTAEINLLDGVTSTTAELNILDGVTSTAAELNILDGVTSTTAELNILDGVTASAADINLIDGITNGTVIASKAIITDANKDITGGRNITITGELDAATLDISGNADIDGTLETDALSINGTTVTSTAAELNILDGVTATAAEINALDGITSTVAELNILDGVTSTAAELNLLDGKAFLDEDDMSSNSATGIASQQSIKAYVDTQITAEDLDITTDSGTIAIDLDSETLTVSGGTGLDSSATGNAVTLAIDSTVATLTGSQTLTNKSLTAPTLTGTAVVASLDISGDIDVDGTTNLDVVDIDGAVDMASTLNVSGAITGTLATAAQPNITSVGTLTGLNVAGTPTFDGLTVDGTGSFTQSSNAATALTTFTNSNAGASARASISFASDTGSSVVGTVSSGWTVDALNANETFMYGSNGVSLFAPASQNVRILAGGSERLRIDSSGNVGIGTTSPSNKLHVQTDTASLTNLINIDNIDSSGNGGALVFTQNNSLKGRIKSYFGSGAWTLGFDTEDTTDALSIIDNGNVGIGTSSPAHKLVVAGSSSTDFDALILRNSNGTNGSAAVLTFETSSGTEGDDAASAAHIKGIREDSGTDGALAFSTTLAGTPTERLRVDSSGNVGINNTQATAINNASGLGNLVVGSGSGAEGITIYSGSDSYGGLNFADATSGGGSYAGYIKFNHVDNSFGHFIGNTERMRIDSSGNVGIGTTGPDYKLHLHNSSQNSYVYMSGGGSLGETYGGFIRGYGVSGSGGNLDLGVNDAGNLRTSINIQPQGNAVIFSTAGSERMRIDSSGNLIMTAGGTIRAGGANDLILDAGESGTPDIYLQSGGSTKVKIEGSDGNVGIGITSLNEGKLHVKSDGAGEVELLTLENSTGTNGKTTLTFKTTSTDATKSAQIFAERVNASGHTDLAFRTYNGSTTEAVRIDHDGNLLVGTTSIATAQSPTSTGVSIRGPIGRIEASADGTTSAIFNRDTSDGSIINFAKDGSTVGIIGAKGGDLTIGTGVVGLRFHDGTGSIRPITTVDGTVTDDTVDLGTTVARFDDIYATNGTIQTSDRNEKQDIEDLTDAETRVAVAAKGLLRKFKWKSAVASKGDNARIHFGIIAQDLQDAFTAEGLDAGDYAMFISNTWTDDDGVEQTRLGVRYSELLAFIIAAI